MKKQIYGALLLLCTVNLQAQWNQMGENINGIEGDKIGINKSTALDHAGNTMAYGSAFNSEFGEYAGYVKVLDWDGETWLQRGSTFYGDETLEGTGAAVDLTADGLTVAVGSSFGINSFGYKCGVVRVFDWDGEAWVMKGEIIEGEGDPNPLFQNDNFGSAISISADGNYIAIGGYANSNVGTTNYQGHVRVYHWEDDNWVQLGPDFDGEFDSESFGYSVSLNDAGNVLAIGARYKSIEPDLIEVGTVTVFEWDGEVWNQVGERFEGEESGDNLGVSVALDAAGNTIIMSAPKAISFSGVSVVYDWNGTEWIQKGGPLIGTSPDFDSPQSGISVAINAEGTIVVAGDLFNSQVLVYIWDAVDEVWAVMDEAITDEGIESINGFGNSVALNADGTRLLVGASTNSDESFNAGQIIVYKTEYFASVAENNELNTSVYPNPTNGQLFFDSVFPLDAEISLINSAGQIVFNQVGVNPQNGIDISSFPAGIYLLEIVNGEEVLNSKVILR